MGITDDIQHSFEPHIRARGEQYLTRVRIVEREGDRLTAAVMGTREYRVRIERRHGKVFSRCECPYAGDVGPCKHQWATLRVAEMRGLLGAKGADAAKGDTAAATEAEPELHDSFEWEDQIDRGLTGRPAQSASGSYGGANPRRTSFGGPRRLPAVTVEPPAPPSWRRIIQAVGVAMQGRVESTLQWPAERELLYVFDPRATLQASGLVLDTVVHDRKRDGSWTKPLATGIVRGDVAHLPDPDDRRILTLLGAVRPASAYGYGPSTEQVPSRHTLGRPMPIELVQAICATGRARLRAGSGPKAELTPLVWDDGPSWAFELQVRHEGSECVVDGVLARGEERVPIGTPQLLVGGGLVFCDGRAARLDDGEAFAWIVALRSQGPIRAPWSEVHAVTASLCDLPRLPALALAPELGLEKLELPPVPHLRLEDAGRSYGLEGGWAAELCFQYGTTVLTQQHGAAAALDRASGRILYRDLAFEKAACDRLAQGGARLWTGNHWSPSPPRWSVTRKALPTLVRGLLGEGWVVEAEGSPWRAPDDFRFEVSTGIDWFDVNAQMEFGTQVVKLPELLAALRRGDGVVRLPDGSLGMLPDDFLGRQALLLGLGTLGPGGLRFQHKQAGLLDMLLASLPQVQWDEGFARVKRELAAFEQVTPADPARGFVGELREYQRHGLGWMQFLRRFGFGGCLADDMGLGKTVQVLALLWSRRQELAKRGPRPSLVVVPRSLIFNWRQEAARFSPKLRVLDLSGAKTEREQARLEDHDLILTTYGLLRRDATRLTSIGFDYVILDEAQAIKNATSIAAKSARLLRAEHRLALSGTPIENHLGELWSLFEFLNPGLLGSAAVFRGAERDPDVATQAQLARALRPFILRRTKAEVAKDLPARVEQTLWCPLGEEQRRLYDELRDHYRATLLKRIDREGLGSSRMHVLEALLRLRQAACHPGLIEDARADGESAKLEVLLEQLAQVREQGGKALVFSQFTSLLALLRRRLDPAGLTYEYLDGKTRDRAARVERFQSDPGCPLFLISLKAGGLGLNLTEAQYVFLLDPWWNPAVEAQAIDRAHRIGQSKTVFAYRLVAQNTIEEKILALQEKKRALADAILGSEGGGLRGLTRADVELLLAG